MISSSLRNSIVRVLSYILLPVALVRVIIECKTFKKFIGYLKNTINTHNDFYQYLETLNFKLDWLNRLYSIQAIPPEFRDFDEDELYDITMRSMLPMRALIERTVLIDVVGITVTRLNEEYYSITITPSNQRMMFDSFKALVVSTVTLASVVLACFFYLKK